MSPELIAILITTTIQVALLVLAIRDVRYTARMVREAEEYRAQFEAVLFGTAKDIWELVRKLRPDFKH